MTETLSRKKFTELKERTDQIADTELDDFWATLEPTTIETMIGEWRGGEFVTGHRMNGGLAKAKWFGKTFVSEFDVKPLCEASLWLEEFRGEVIATMVYDGQPIHDHFKQIDDGAVMGIMNGKHVLDAGRYFYFYLERV